MTGFLSVTRNCSAWYLIGKIIDSVIISGKYNLDVNQKMQGGTSSADIEAYKQYFNFLNEKEKKLQLEQQETEQRITDKQQEIIEIKTEISGLEKLREKQLAEYNKALQKQQELEIEEFLNEKISGTN